MATWLGTVSGSCRSISSARYPEGTGISVLVGDHDASLKMESPQSAEFVDLVPRAQGFFHQDPSPGILLQDGGQEVWVIDGGGAHRPHADGGTYLLGKLPDSVGERRVVGGSADAVGGPDRREAACSLLVR